MRALHLVRIIALEYYLIYKDDICLFTLKWIFLPGMDFIHDGFSVLVLNPAFNINYSSWSWLVCSMYCCNFLSSEAQRNKSIPVLIIRTNRPMFTIPMWWQSQRL
jgi:hypothetical protein